MAQVDGKRPLVNVNVGVLGHVDSGKTNLVRVLSTQLSTAALDKNPQSQQRGITLDLGFSAFRLPPTTELLAHGSSSTPIHTQAFSDQEIQITLVDCPGHASLFKTILGGARIIDMVLLVVDVQKGLQPQSIESLVVAELAVQHHVVVALNKIDLVPERVREKRVRRVQSEIRAFLTTHFKSFRDQVVPIIPVAAAPAADTERAPVSLGIAELVHTIRSHLYVPERDASGPFSLAIDHCFAIQGNGTILTGTVLSGAVRIGDEIEISSLQVVKKVKSMQMFRTSVTAAAQGDRVGIRVNGLDASLVERGMAITPRTMVFVAQVIVPVHQIAFFRGGSVKTGGKFHATVGHATVLAVATFFSRIGSPPLPLLARGEARAFDPTVLYEHVAQIEPLTANAEGDDSEKQPERSYYALLQFDQPILCQPDALVVCSRLDLDPKRVACRLAFHGRVQAIVTAATSSTQDTTTTESSHMTSLNSHSTMSLGDLRIGKIKSREGIVDKVVTLTGESSETNEPHEVIGRDLFSKNVDWRVYAGVSVLFEASRALGRIRGPFGKAGKFRIELLAQAFTQKRHFPVAGERIVLRFVKLVVLKAPVVKGKGLGGKASGAVPTAKGSKAARNLLQDDQLLYPEAFVLKEHPSTREDRSSTSEELLDNNNLKENHEPVVESEQTRGQIERLKGETTSDGRNPSAIVTGLFSSDQQAFAAIGRQVVVVFKSETLKEEEKEVGEIEKPFGKAGKVRVLFTENGGTLAQVGDGVMILQPRGL